MVAAGVVMMDHGQRHLLGLDLKESGTFLCLM